VPQHRSSSSPVICAVSPLLFGIGVSLDYMFGSKTMLDMLSWLGFSASYDEVNRYKQCVVQCDTEDLCVSYPSHFTQWSGDNMDHNLCTLDGQNTVHGMGIVSMSTPCSPDMTGSYTHTLLNLVMDWHMDMECLKVFEWCGLRVCIDVQPCMQVCGRRQIWKWENLFWSMLS